jgi:hypothetical protein
MKARDHSPGAQPDEPAGVAPHDAVSPTVAGQAAHWPAALAAGLIAGVAAWLIGEVAHEFFEPAEVEVIRMGVQTRGPNFDTENEATLKNALLVFGSLGGVLGVALGVGAGMARRAPRSAATAAVVGLMLGVLAGAGTAAVVLPPALRSRSFREDDLLRPFLVHAALWTPIGAAGGTAFALGAGRRGSALAAAALGGALGTLFGTAAYELIGGLAFPMARTDGVISLTWPTRLIARLSVTLGAAVGAALGAQGRRRTSGPSAGPT